MKKTILIWTMNLLNIFLLLSCVKNSQTDFPLQPVPLTQVQLADNFWSRRIETNRTVTIPYAFKKCEELGRMDNFAIAGGLKSGKHRGIYAFDDSDVYKLIEGASYTLSVHPDVKLNHYVDSLITLIAAAQEDDGYLFTCRTNKSERLQRSAGPTRWSNLQWSHELYNMGHLYEAAVAHFQTTGKRALLEVAIKNANLLASTFGPNGLQLPPGHQEIEIGLAKLYRVTGEKKYLALAKFFLDQRGHASNGRKLWGEYAQDHQPIFAQNEAVGHAVRQAYMNAGLLEVAALTGDPRYSQASTRLWENVVGKKLYITGGLGSIGNGERFAANYDLPNLSAYQETCTAIANAMWNHRFFLLTGEAKYIDVMERTLYNGLLAGIAMSGEYFFYPNPLASRGYHERSPWFDCPCCISNMSRFLPALPSYIYGYTNESVYVNLFAASRAVLTLNQTAVQIQQETQYPWNGSVKITVTPEQPVEFDLRVRIPGWAQNQPVPTDLYHFQNENVERATLKVNGATVAIALQNGYMRLSRRWQNGDVVELDLPMPVRRVVANENVKDDLGKIVLQRGPIVYCLEWPDHRDGHVMNLLLPDEAELTSEYRADLLNGVTVIKGKANEVTAGNDGTKLVQKEQDFVAVPYFAWAHRGAGEMTVWIPNELSRVAPINGSALSTTARASSSGGDAVVALNDQRVPKNSQDFSSGVFVWTPRRDTVWVQYDFPKLEEISAAKVYWFANQNCQPPQSWRILAQIDGKWEPVYNPTRMWGVVVNQYNQAIFETVRTSAMRLEAILQPNFNGGILEWEVD